ncbi:putative ribonuclease H protein [Hibiscus syriacus]|uniref:Ribonuclease H protein n=1 Tax=Hibiscus syriacus TaxID=106335 RepID=A0A6A3ASS2_HIBSY|nr:putative ribonuclease H protein [Hibiscus syriacus]
MVTIKLRGIVQDWLSKDMLKKNVLLSMKYFLLWLNKSLYDLKQAPRCWYKRFDSIIMCLGYNRLNVDPCAYFKRSGDNDFVILLLYVDDMLVAGPNKDHIEELKAQLAREFEMKDLRSANKILGMQIYRDRSNRKIWLSQKNYLKKILSRFSMQDCKPISTPLPINFKLSSSMSPSSEEERMEMSRVLYVSAVGSLMFAMICTRPDIAQAMGVVSRYMANSGKEHWNTVKRILRYIKGTSNVVLCYGGSNLLINGHVDSDYAWDLDKSKSTTGYVFKIAGGAVSWVSKLQSVAATSTTEAEYVAATQASKEAIWLKMLLEELGHNQDCDFALSDSRLLQQNLHYRLKAVKKDEMTMCAYISHVKEIYDALAAYEGLVSDHKKVTTVLSGLPIEYKPVVAMIMGLESRLRLMELFRYFLLLNSNKKLCDKNGHLVDRRWYRFDKSFPGVSSIANKGGSVSGDSTPNTGRFNANLIKCQAAQAFILFQKMVKQQFGVGIKVVQSDWGVERKHQHVLEMTFVLLARAFLPIEGCLCLKFFYGKPPLLDHLKVFECRWHALISISEHGADVSNRKSPLGVSISSSEHACDAPRGIYVDEPVMSIILFSTVLNEEVYIVQPLGFEKVANAGYRCCYLYDGENFSLKDLGELQYFLGLEVELVHGLEVKNRDRYSCPHVNFTSCNINSDDDDKRDTVHLWTLKPVMIYGEETAVLVDSCSGLLLVLRVLASYVTYHIKEVKLQFPVFREAMMHQEDLFMDINDIEDDGLDEFRRVLAEKIDFLTKNPEELANKERCLSAACNCMRLLHLYSIQLGNTRQSPETAESLALFTDHLLSQPGYIIGQIVNIECQTVKPLPSSTARLDHCKADVMDQLTYSDRGTEKLTMNSGSSRNLYDLPIGCEYFVVTAAMLPDATIHSPSPPSTSLKAGVDMMEETELYIGL